MTQLHLHRPGYIDIKIDFPSCWNDLSLEELKIVSRCILMAEKDPTGSDARLLLGILQERVNKETSGRNRRKLRNIRKMLDAEQTFISMWPAMQFIFQNNTLTIQPFPTLKIKKTWLRLGVEFAGPKDDFNSLTAGEFEDAEFCFGEFRAKPDREPLAKLAAILFREKGTPYMIYDKDQDKLEPYDIEPWLPYFRRLSDEVLYIIFLWYCGCRNVLPKIFPNCFEGGEDNAEPDPATFTKTIHAGAGEKNGSRERIRQMLLKEFLFDMEQEIINNKKLEQLYNEHNR